MTDDRLDEDLVTQAREGNRTALEALIARHRAFVYGVAHKLFGTHTDADDLVQEVFVKAITNLANFRGASAFRTWLYRIAMNHFLDSRRRGRELEEPAFLDYFDAIDAIPDEPLDESPEIAGISIDALRVRCTSGMLLCLDRPQRLVFVLGAMFSVSHTLGAELLEISPANFRVRLHRARTDLYSWMGQRCGLVNTANPCRCANKTRHYRARGLLDERGVFREDHLVRVDSLVRHRARDVMATVDDLHERYFQDHPRYEPTSDLVVSSILGHPTIQSFFDL